MSEKIVIVHKDCGGEATYDSMGNYQCNKCGFTSKDTNYIEVFESGKRLWHLPLSERFIKVDKMPLSALKLMELDGIGFVLEHDAKNPEHLKPDFIRRHLVGVRDTFSYVYADTKEKAIQKFHDEWDGAKMGTKSKALWIKDESQVYSLPFCERLDFNEGEFKFSCGKVDPNDPSDSAPGCILDSFDPPDDCPVAEQSNRSYMVRTIVSYKPKKHAEYKKFGGAKTSTVCPHCGNHKTFKYQGRYKYCLSCGYNNQLEKRVKLTKWMKNRGRIAELKTDWLDAVSDYANKMKNF